MAVDTRVRLTVEEYLAWEENNFEKHEYIDGEARCMAGAKGRHNRIMMNLAVTIGRQLDDSDCFLLSSEMRVKAGETRYVYPDLTAVCGEEEYARENEMELLNPVLVIEVTSPSSLPIDRGEKQDYYFEMPSVEAYLIIDQHRVCAELCIRGHAGWKTTTFTSLGDTITLEAINCELPLAQVYRGIVFDRTED
ncbi:MAG: Uma2 family endonuclease [Chloroflexi bacterium]|nr:Uma2 family endonuclease [Chloroflexota bacterium]